MNSRDELLNRCLLLCCAGHLWLLASLRRFGRSSATAPPPADGGDKGGRWRPNCAAARLLLPQPWTDSQRLRLSLPCLLNMGPGSAHLRDLQTPANEAPLGFSLGLRATNS